MGSCCWDPFSLFPIFLKKQNAIFPVMKMMSSSPLRYFLAWLLLAWSSLAPAQNADPLIFTVGKTFETNGGATLHNYLLWQPGDAATTFGKRFAIYAKDGDAGAANPYTKLGIQTLQTSPSAIQALLKLGEKFDADGAGLPEMVVALNAEANGVPLPAGFAFPNKINLAVAQELAQIMTIAQTDPEVLQSLVSLGRAHPGVQMAIGLGWAIETAPASITTYEVREIDLADADLRVVGRVTLDASNPQSLVAPGRPFQLPHPVAPELQLVASAKDHLTVRLRWGTPNPLRALLPHTYGYNLYRVPKDSVDAVTADPATLTEALDITNIGGVKVNMLPIPASALLTDLEAANPLVQPEAFFFGDDKNPPAEPFADGDTFYYYVAARDIAGHPGPLSPPTEITICDRLPPSTPAIVSVDNVFDLAGSDPANDTGTQHLRITIRQVPETPAENRAVKYRVYRWHSPTDWLRHGGDPELNFIGEVDHLAGKDYVTFEDDDATDADIDGPGGSGPDGMGGVDTGAPVVTSESDPEMGQTFWYTIRAVDGSACSPANLSGHCGAVYGVPRDRVGPSQPEGSLVTCTCLPRVSIANEAEPVSRSPYGVSDSFPGFVVRVSRVDGESSLIAKIKSFDVQLGTAGFDPQQNPTFTPLFNRTYYYKGMETFSDILVPYPDSGGTIVRVRARLGDGSVSSWRAFPSQGKPSQPGEITLYAFRAWVELCCPTLISSRVLRDEEGNIRSEILALLPTTPSGDPNCPPWIETSPGATPSGFSPVGADGSLTGVSGQVFLFGDIREVRVYRRVGEAGSLELIDRLSGESALPTEYNWQEAAPVLLNGVEVCYFAQTFDEHGNASPLTRIGCVFITNEDLGIPMVMDPVSLPEVSGTAFLKLSWFCDPNGVDRFELWVASEGGTDPGVESADLTQAIATDGSNPVLTTEEGELLTFSIYRTDAISSGFGENYESAGEFCLTLAVPADQKLYYALRPIGQQIPDVITEEFEFVRGDFSNMVSAAWTAPPVGLQSVIPWPARPLPGVAGVSVPVSSYAQGEGPFYAHPIPSTSMNSMGASAGILCGVFPAVDGREFTYEGSFLADRDPLDWLFKTRTQPTETSVSSELESIVPFVVYRYQVPSTRFPSAQPNLIQITPLIDRMAYETRSTKDKDSKNYDYYQVQDPFFLFSYVNQTSPAPMPVPIDGIFSRDPSTFVTQTLAGTNDPNAPLYMQVENSQVLAGVNIRDSAIWVRDTQPASAGASYQYLIVSFSEVGEIKRVIPTNVLSHP